MKKRTGKENNSERLVIPTIFAHNKREFDSRFRKLKNISKVFQIDFMDGEFVPGRSVDLKDISDLKETGRSFEAHLMTIEPWKKIKKLKKKGFEKIIFHYEAAGEKIEKTIKKINKFEMGCFVAVNPETTVKKIFPYIEKIDGVLLMGVHPGKEHQKFVPEIYSKVEKLKKKFSHSVVQIDGGVNLTTARKLKKSGADILNTGSFVAEAKSPKKALEELKEVFC